MDPLHVVSLVGASEYHEWVLATSGSSSAVQRATLLDRGYLDFERLYLFINAKRGL